jgi:hypothetical protein
MKLSMTRQDKGDLLIQVATWADLTVQLPFQSVTKILNARRNKPSTIYNI